MAERLDTYDRMPEGMREYLSFHGRNFSRPMYLWAVSMMKDRNGAKVQPMEKEQVMEALKKHGVTDVPDMGYNIPYTFCMAKSDYLNSSVPDETHQAMFVKDYLNDKDGYESRAFDEFMSKLIAKGIPVDWVGML